MRIDLHSHTQYSPDSTSPVHEVLQAARKSGLDGIAITDHNAIEGSLKAVEIASGLLVVPAVEVSTTEGHLIGLGVRTIIRAGLSVVETAEQIRAQGGLPIAAHPWRRRTGMGPQGISAAHIEVIETFNARTWSRNNAQALRFAQEGHQGQSGGSDAHTIEEVGAGYVELPYPVSDADTLIEALRKGDGQGRGVQRGMGAVATTTSFNVGRWLRRGGKNI